MAKADAHGAAAAGKLAPKKRKPEGREQAISGPARLLAEPAYQKFLAAEPILRRAIPIMTVVFLLIVATVRFVSLSEQKDELLLQAKADISLVAELLQVKSQVASVPEMLPDIGNLGAGLTAYMTLIASGQDGRIAATRGPIVIPVGVMLDEVLSDGQPLLLFGERAGVMEVSVDGRHFLAAARPASKEGGQILVLLDTDSLLKKWDETASMNVTLFVVTSGLLLVILFAYFTQVTRAKNADRIYSDTHSRIDLALSRGRCGLWDWDMARGRLYWSRSMYELLGYEPRDAILDAPERIRALELHEHAVDQLERRAADAIQHVQRNHGSYLRSGRSPSVMRSVWVLPSRRMMASTLSPAPACARIP